MPSRGMVLFIVVFWLCSMGLLLYIEVLPYYQTSEVPPFVIEITDEVGSAEVAWDLILKRNGVEEKPIRTISRISPINGEEFEMVNECSESFQLAGLDFRKVRFTYRVTRRGELRGLAIEGEFTQKNVFVSGKYVGQVKDGVLSSEIQSNILGRSVLADKDFSHRAGVLNPMQLLHKLDKQVREGQEWMVEVFDPLSILVSLFLPQSPAVSKYRATVAGDVLEWDDQRVPCLKIEYLDSHKRDQPRAATWIRKADHIVLKQWCNVEGNEFTAVRLPQS
jgi:hypothetical protein